MFRYSVGMCFVILSCQRLLLSMKLLLKGFLMVLLMLTHFQVRKERTSFRLRTPVLEQAKCLTTGSTLGFFTVGKASTVVEKKIFHYKLPTLL